MVESKQTKIKASDIAEEIFVSTREEYNKEVVGKSCLVYFFKSSKGQPEFPTDNLLIQAGHIIQIVKINVDQTDGAFRAFIEDIISGLDTPALGFMKKGECNLAIDGPDVHDTVQLHEFLKQVLRLM